MLRSCDEDLTRLLTRIVCGLREPWVCQSERRVLETSELLGADHPLSQLPIPSSSGSVNAALVRNDQRDHARGNVVLLVLLGDGGVLEATPLSSDLSAPRVAQLDRLEECLCLGAGGQLASSRQITSIADGENVGLALF